MTDKQIISAALSDAVAWRQSLAEAWPKGSPERDEAMNRAKRYEVLHQKMFGQPTHRKTCDDALRGGASISIFDIGKDRA